MSKFVESAGSSSAQKSICNGIVSDISLPYIEIRTHGHGPEVMVYRERDALGRYVGLPINAPDLEDDTVVRGLKNIAALCDQLLSSLD